VNATNTRSVERASSSRLHHADLLSGLGAVVLGVGIGLFVAKYHAAVALPILLTGLAVHGWGMFDKRRLERGALESIWWVDALYWLCWLLLIAVAGIAMMAL
jgi:hypothetical protein